MRKVILYRNIGHLTSDSEEKSQAETSGFFVLENRTKVNPSDFIIPRYSAWPFYKELYEDVLHIGSKLINNPHQFNYISDLQNWVYDLSDLTPTTWDRLENLPEEGPFILKGETNSRKFEWNSLMFAKNKAEAIQVHSNLLKDSLIGSQKIYIRKYVPLKTYTHSFMGLPITHEFRFFVCYGEIISGGYYWSSHTEDLPEKPNVDSVPKSFLKEVISRVGNNNNFYAIDVAQTESGDWVVIELNSGEQSGLSDNLPSVLYSNLNKVLSSKF